MNTNYFILFLDFQIIAIGVSVTNKCAIKVLYEKNMTILSFVFEKELRNSNPVKSQIRLQYNDAWFGMV